MNLPIVIFLGSFLSFALEPMIGRTLLPVFGGSPSVWVTCLAAFQLMMIGGYGYAGRVERSSFLAKIHIILLLVASAWCAGISFYSKPILSTLSEVCGIPALDVLICVLILCGISFILLSANATIVQTLSGGNYRLYAVSNAGSLIGLLSYPILVEPYIGLKAQWLVLAGGILLYAALLAFALSNNATISGETSNTEDLPASNRSQPVLWLLLPLFSCALLNATTTHLTLDVMPMPLLWAILLALFLLSYIIGFSGWGKPSIFAVLAVISVCAAAWGNLSAAKDATHFQIQLIACSALVLFGSTFLHSVLYGLRPAKEELPRYYFYNVIGGAIGGVLTSIFSPMVFSTVSEFPIVEAVVPLSVIAYALREPKRFLRPYSILLTVLAVAGLVIIGIGSSDRDLGGRTIVHRSRGFFGTIEVMSAKAKMASGAEGELNEFTHGHTVHGIQARIPGKERDGTCYYTKNGCGYAITGHPNYRNGVPMRVNLVGLGVGVMFGYGREGDYYRAYEISPEVLSVATNASLFSFIADCPAKKDIILGDARKGLEKELADGVEPYDVIFVDAFTGDNIPYHLSTKEAFDLYFKLLKPDGILCVNISNWHLELEPYIKKMGAVFDCPLFGMWCPEDLGQLRFDTVSVFFCRDPRGMSAPPVQDGISRMIPFGRIPMMDNLPTDDCGSFLPLIKH